MSLPYGERMWSADEEKTIQHLLGQKLGVEHLAVRQGAGNSQFVYVESWKAIELANGIFGFNGWSSSIVEITPDFIDEVQGKFRVGITAVVRVTLKDGTSHEDVGFGIGENRIKGEAIQKAKKEAVSDARKRALRLFGNGLGNTIYDREYTMVIKRTQSQKQKGVLPSVTYEALRSGAVLLNHDDHVIHHSEPSGHSNGGPMNVGHAQHNNCNNLAQPPNLPLRVSPPPLMQQQPPPRASPPDMQAPQQQRPPVPPQQQQHSVQPPQQMVYQPQPAVQQQYPPHTSGQTSQFEGEIDDSTLLAAMESVAVPANAPPQTSRQFLPPHVHPPKIAKYT